MSKESCFVNLWEKLEGLRGRIKPSVGVTGPQSWTLEKLSQRQQMKAVHITSLPPTSRHKTCPLGHIV